MLLFDEYAPDVADLLQGSRNITNVIPEQTGYRSFPSLTNYSTSLSARCRGAVTAKDRDGNVYHYAGDVNTLYSLDTTTFTSIVTAVTGTDFSFSASQFIRTVTTDLSVFSAGQKVLIAGSTINNGTFTLSLSSSTTLLVTDETTITGGTASGTVTVRRVYATDDAENWEFAQYGNQVIAVNWNDPPQTVSLGGTQFTNLAGSPPKARAITVADNFVHMGNLNEGGVSYPNRLRWCALGNPLSWTADASTQADFQDFDTGGHIKALSGGDNIYIFQEYGIWLGTYVGSPNIYDFSNVEPNRGTPAARSVARIGRYAFYLGQDGFYVFDGNQSIPIGVNKVDQTFYDDFDQTYHYRMSSAIDPFNNLVLWAYPGTGNAGGLPNKILVYHWAHKKWASVSLETQFIYSQHSKGYTLDSLDALSGSIDALTVSLDSAFYIGGALNLAAFTSSNVLAQFIGSAMTATVETQEHEHNVGMRSQVTKVRPVVQNETSASSSLSLYVGTRDRQTTDTSWSSAITVNTTDHTFNTRTNARFHKYRLSIAGGFGHCLGLQPTVVKGSKR